MAKIANPTFKGKTGGYRSEVYSADTLFDAVGGCLCFYKRSGTSEGRGTHTFLYIGQTESLKNRIPNQEKWPVQARTESIVFVSIMTTPRNHDSPKKRTCIAQIEMRESRL